MQKRIDYNRNYNHPDDPMVLQQQCGKHIIDITIETETIQKYNPDGSVDPTIKQYAYNRGTQFGAKQYRYGFDNDSFALL